MTDPDTIAAELFSAKAERRERALEAVASHAHAPSLFASGVIHCLRAPLDPDPLGEESALVLACCSALAESITGFRDTVAGRLRALEAAADGPRATTLRRLAREALAKIDAAIGQTTAMRAAEIASLAALVRAGQQEEAVAAVLRASSPHFYPELVRAAYWEDLGDELARSGEHDVALWCYGHAHTGYAQHALYATSGGEGLARMIDVDRIDAKLRR